MGNLSTDLINFLNDIGITNAEAIKPLADFIGLIGDVGGVVGGISSIINLVNQWQGTDQLTKITNAIGDVSTALGDYFHQLGQDEGASQILQRNSKLNDIIAGPSTQYGLLTNAMGKQLTSDEIKNYVQPCIYALNEFEGPAQPDLVWGVTFDWEIFWTDYGLYTNTCYNYPYVFSIDAGYGQRTPTKDGFGNVLYYTITLPVYLQAIWFFLAVAGALDPAFPQKYKPDLQSAANKLTNVYSDITTNGKGLTTLSPPNWSSAGLVNTPCPGATAESVGIRLVYQEPVNPTELVIQGALIEYGAVEKFSGCSSVCASYQINFDSASDPFDPAIFNKLQLRLLKHVKDVFVSTGLLNVFQTINQLNALAGDPPISGSTFQWSDGSMINLVDWSFRQIIGLAKLAPSANGVSLRALGGFIIGTQPFDSPYSPRATSFSFRNLLTEFPD